MSRRTGAVAFDVGNEARDGDVEMNIEDNTFKGGNGSTYVGTENYAAWDIGGTIKNNKFHEAGDVDVGNRNRAGRYAHMDYHCNEISGATGGVRMGTGNKAGRDSRSKISSNYIG